jgi:hypothetical protein
LRSTTKSVITTGFICLALLLSGVAAGANQGASPKKWVGVLCGSLVTWEQTVKSETGKLKAEINKLSKAGPVNLGVARSQLTGFLGRLVGSTNTLLGKLKAVGPPAVTNGSKLEAALLKGLGAVNTGFQNGKNASQALPTNNRTAFSKGAKNIGLTISASGNQAQGALAGIARYDSKPLDDAFKANKTCSKIGG